MAYIQVPKDLSRVKSKVMFGLTKRQIICFGGGALIGLPLFFLTRSFAGVSPAAIVMILSMLPCFLFGMYERDGQPLEVVLSNVLQTLFLRPKQRPYQTDNFYAALMRQDRLDKEVQRIVRKTKTQTARKAAQSQADTVGEKADRQAGESSPAQ